MEIDERTRMALEHILDYTEDDERDDYQASKEVNPKKAEGHIYNDIQAVRKWLDGPPRMVNLREYVAVKSEHSSCMTCKKTVVLLSRKSGDNGPQYYMCECGMLAEVGGGVLDKGGEE